MSLIKKLAGETVIYGVSSILPRVLHYIVFTIYLTRKFPVQSDYGIYKDLYAYATIILVLLVYRMDTAFFRFGSREDGVVKTFTTGMIPIFFTSLIIVGLMWFNADSIAGMLKYPDQAYYVKWFALILGFDALTALPFAKFRLENRPMRFLTVKMLNVILTIALVFFFLELCPILKESGSSWVDRVYNPDKKLDYIFLSNLIASFVVFLFVLPELLKEKFHFDLALWKKMLKYSLPLVIVGIAGNINTAFAAPLQKYFLGGDLAENLTNVGIYAAPASLAIFLNLFNVAFNYAAEPFFFKNYKESNRENLFGKVALLYTIFGAFVLLGILMYLDTFMKIMGSDYRSATEIVPILLFANLFLGLYYNFSIWYKLKDKTHIGAIISIVGAIITLVISIIFLPKIGYLASAWAAFACFAFMAVAGYVTGRIYYPIDYPVFRILIYIGIAFLLFKISVYFSGLGLSAMLFFLLNSFLLLVYIGLAFILDKRTLKEMFTSN